MSEATKHTPGPWFARQMFSGNWDIAAENGNGATLARTPEEADAHLIEAAPDLLEAAEEIFKSSTSDHDAAKKLLTAIVKARGKNA